MSYAMIDTHCHPQFPQYDEDRDRIIREALDKGVAMVCVGTDLGSSKAAIELAEAYNGVYATVGLHPNDFLENDSLENESGERSGDKSGGESGGESGDDVVLFEALLKHPKVIAVGEIGLDYYRTRDSDLQARQRDRLSGFLDLAFRNDLPVIIHCRDAHADMIEVLDRHSEHGRVSLKGGVIHSFTGTWEDAQRYIELGYHIGLNGIITFARDYDKTILNMPIERMLIETDAPYLAPVPYRGKRNEPLYIEEVVKQLATMRRMDLGLVQKVTTDNALRLFSKVHISID